MEQRISSIKEQINHLRQKDPELGCSSTDLFRDIVEKSCNSQQKQEFLNSLIMNDLVKVETVAGIVNRMNGSVDNDTISGSTELIDAQLHEMTDELLELTNSQVPITLEAYFQSFAAQQNELSQLVEFVESEYAEVSKLQNMIQTANEEESRAKQRMTSDLATLQSTASRISSELEYIKRERDNLKLRRASDFPVMPLEELLSVAQPSHNDKWKELLHNARYSPLSYN